MLKNISKSILIAVVLSNIFGIMSFATEIVPTQSKNTEKIMAEDLSLVKQQLILKIQHLSSFSAQFSQTVFDVEGNLLQENTGDLAVSKPNLLHWQVNKPNESLIVSDGKALWLYDPFIEQVSIYSANGAISNTPILLLANSDQALWQNYEVELVKENHYLIKSKDSNSQVKSLELAFDRHEKLNEFVILDATGQRSRVKLSDVLALTHVQQTELFTFKTPAGVDIDDQR